MSYVLHRSLKNDLPMVVGGEGNYLIDASGKRYLDACGGAAVSCLGHDNPKVRAAITTQLNKIAFAHTSFFTNGPAEELAEFLVKRAPEGTGEGRAMFLASGSEAMEAALKLARQFHIENGQPMRTKIIARRPSYHGNTLGALATGGHAGRRAPFQPLLIDVSHIDAPYAYRMQRADETEKAFGLRMANLLDQQIHDLGPETVMAFVVEPVVGASLGTQPSPPGYFQSIRDICYNHGVLLIADEVMCGMGRTGTLFALEQEVIAADITTMAKGLGAGYQPIAAVLASENVIARVMNGSGKLWNGHTYMSHAVGAAGALAVLKVVEEDGLLANVKECGKLLHEGLEHILGRHPNVGNIRGRGLFWSVELVADRESKTPFPVEINVAMRVHKAALDLGLMTYPAQGCADGTLGDHLLLAPSYTSNRQEIEQIVSLLELSISEVLS